MKGCKECGEQNSKNAANFFCRLFFCRCLTTQHRAPPHMEEEHNDDDGKHVGPLPAVVFRPPPMAGVRGASLAKGGRRLSGRVCWNYFKCPFGEACKYAHPAAPAADAAPTRTRTRGAPPLKYMLLKAQKQLGPDPSQSLLVACLEQDGRFTCTRKPEECDLLWGLSHPTGSHVNALPPHAL
jgi:hypothetical protein